MTLIADTHSYRIARHPVHARLRHIDLDPARLKRFFAAANDIDVQQLEYVPYMRFVLAHMLDQQIAGLAVALRRAVEDRPSGGFTTGVFGVTAEPDDYVKFGTAIAHMLGAANFDAMSGTYFARFSVKHTDDSDSYLRQAYRTMTLHTDGTYVQDQTDYLLMMKFAEQHALGGETRVLHLDDWEALDTFVADATAEAPMGYGAPPSKNVTGTVTHPTFFRTTSGWCVSFIDQFARPETIEQALYLKRMSSSLETSPATIAVPLPVGDLIVLNNAFWMHGRAAFERDVQLHRELMRIRGKFAPV